MRQATKAAVAAAMGKARPVKARTPPSLRRLRYTLPAAPPPVAPCPSTLAAATGARSSRGRRRATASARCVLGVRVR